MCAKPGFAWPRPMSKAPGCWNSSPRARPGSGGDRLRAAGTSGERSLLRPVVPLALAVLLLGAATIGTARGQEARPPDQPTSVWLYALYKTITYETVANLADIPLYYTVLAGAPGGTALFTAINVTTAAAAYYGYEVAWNLYAPPLGDSPGEAVRQEIGKTLLYRVVSSARNVVLAYALTGSYGATLGFVLINNLVDTVIYVGNEYAWYRYGPPVATVWGKGASLQDAATGLGVSATATDSYRVAAIAAGTLVGVIGLNAVSGGAATPVLALGTSGGIAAAQGAAAYLTGFATTALGAMAGGYAGELALRVAMSRINQSFR
jgi:uncharacterized membrane protein